MAGFLDWRRTSSPTPASGRRGRLILSFRKEWLAEIKKRLAERGCPAGGLPGAAGPGGHHGGGDRPAGHAASA